MTIAAIATWPRPPGDSGCDRRPRAVIKKELPFDALDGPRTSLQLRARLPPRLLAHLNERERIPATLLASRAGRGWKDRMCPHLPEPIRRIAGIRLLPVYDGVPIAALRRWNVLRDGVRLIETREVHIKPAQRRFRCARSGEQPGRRNRPQPLAGGLRRTPRH